ncbi:hypothetical protein V3C99_016303 [Haemonchus contortus]
MLRRRFPSSMPSMLRRGGKIAMQVLFAPRESQAKRLRLGIAVETRTLDDLVFRVCDISAQSSLMSKQALTVLAFTLRPFMFF